jgi:hypothetical protein
MGIGAALILRKIFYDESDRCPPERIISRLSVTHHE